MSRRKNWTKAGKRTVRALAAKGGRKASKASGRSIALSIERARIPSIQSGFVDLTYRVRIPKNARPSEKAQLVKSVIAAMRRDGIETLPRKGKYEQAKFFVLLEGEAIDAKSGKRVRARTGLFHTGSLEKAEFAGTDKVNSLLHGASLANEPFKTTGSGTQSMIRGPDTIYVTAIYSPDAKVPGLDYIKPKRKSVKRKPMKRQPAKRKATKKPAARRKKGR